MINTFKSTEHLNQAILEVACDEKHGNKSRVIIESLMANPAIAKKLSQKQKRLKANGSAGLILKRYRQGVF